MASSKETKAHPLCERMLALKIDAGGHEQADLQDAPGCAPDLDPFHQTDRGAPTSQAREMYQDAGFRSVANPAAYQENSRNTCPSRNALCKL